MARAVVDRGPVVLIENSVPEHPGADELSICSIDVTGPPGKCGHGGQKGKCRNDEMSHKSHASLQ